MFLEFKALMQITGANPYVLVSAVQASSLRNNWRKPMPVVLQVNNKPDLSWHINMMPVGNGDFYLYLHNHVRKASNTKVGDEITVKIWFDDSYHNGPLHDMPKEFSLALDQHQAAATHWHELTPSRQKEVLRYFAGLKSETALQRNISKAVYVLEGKRERFMGRDWTDGK
jgi:hypothetical protein